MSYVQGFVIPILPGRRDDYIALAREASGIFLEHGALQVVETLDDDVPHGKATDFYRSVDAGDGEVIAFSWIVWPSKAARDEGMAKVMADERMAPGAKEMPFDMRRMIFGGFETILDTNAG